MKRRLFAHERELQSWRSITLTTHRIIHLDAWHGFEGSTSILLSHLQWTSIARSHRPILLVVAGLLGALCMYAFGQGDRGVGGISFAAAAGSALVYLASRRATLVLAAGSGRIELPVDPSTQGRQQARDFVDAIEDAAGRASSLGALDLAP